jgi:hypothetical protein
MCFNRLLRDADEVLPLVRHVFDRGFRRLKGHADLPTLLAALRARAEENPTWSYSRIRGALKNVGHPVGRSTIARILRAQGFPPVPEPADILAIRRRQRLGGLLSYYYRAA